MMYTLVLRTILLCIIMPAAMLESKKNNIRNEGSQYWNDLGKKELKSALRATKLINTNIAKNVIIFIGDGMSLPTLTAARIYKAQYKARKEGSLVSGEESSLTFQTFPHAAFSKTYCLNRQTPDSASTASAIFSGIKTNYRTMGYDDSIVYDDIYSQISANKVETILKWAQDANKDTGFVTTARVSHATPAALYAHVANRDYECDKELPSNSPEGAEDITYQLIANDPGRKVKVVMGGGLVSWVSKEEHNTNWKQPSYFDYERTAKPYDCDRLDSKNLIGEFLRKNESVPGFEKAKGKFVRNRSELLKMDVADTDYILGLFSDGHMQYEDLREVNQSQPSLSEMTKVAINMLKKNKQNGFFLMVEQSNIDKAHHRSRATQSLHETMVLDDAVETALDMVDTEETLIIVTSDHSHTMSMGGYESRGSDIRGLSDKELGSDGMPFSILTYAQGQGFGKHLTVNSTSNMVSRVNLTGQEDSYKSFSFQNPAAIPRESETHGGDDVGIFAIGPFAHLFHSVHEQSYIGHVMAYGACIGPYKDDEHCQINTNSAVGLNMNIILLYCPMILVFKTLFVC